MCDKKLIEKAKKKLHRLIPGAKVTVINDVYTIVDSEGTDILDLYFLPKTDNLLQTYKLGELAARTTQLFDRTHPDRLSLEDSTEKSYRINRKRNLV
jgi:hypothetical protein